MMLRTFGPTTYITGMRAFAALGVFIIHTGGAGLRSLGLIGNWIADLGQAGVYSFFVISGFSITQNIYKNRPHFIDFFSKRLRKIVPTYFFWLAISCVFLVPEVATPYNVGMHLLFLSFLDHEIAGSLMSVEWTLPIEVFWYLFLPLMIGVTYAFPMRMILLLIAASSISIASHYYHWLSPSITMPSPQATHVHPVPYMMCFVMGIVAHKLRTYHIGGQMRAAIIYCVSLTVIAFLLIPHEPVFFGEIILFVSATTFIFVAFGSQDMRLIRCLFMSKPAVFLGTLSYDFYLCHCIVIWAVSRALHLESPAAVAVISLPITVLVSLATYFLMAPGCSNIWRQVRIALLGRLS